MSRAVLAGVTSTPAPVVHHVRVSGGGVVVQHSWPEHIARAEEAIRRRRATESRVRSRSGEWL